MKTVRVSSKGQIVIPKAIRESQNIKAGTEFVISSVRGELRLTPAPSLKKTSIKAAAGILHRRSRKYLDEDATRKAIGRMIRARNKATRG